MPYELVPSKDTAGTTGLSLFYFPVYMKDTDSNKTCNVFELLQIQF